MGVMALDGPGAGPSPGLAYGDARLAGIGAVVGAAARHQRRRQGQVQAGIGEA